MEASKPRKFSELSGKELKHLIAGRLAMKADGAAAYATQQQVAKEVEKSELIKIVRKFVDEEDIDELLKLPKASPVPAPASDSAPPVAKRGANGKIERTGGGSSIEESLRNFDPVKMKEQAQMMIKHPKQFKMQASQARQKGTEEIARMSESEIVSKGHEMMKQLEDPDKMKAAMEQYANMTPEEKKMMESSQKIFQKSGISASDLGDDVKMTPDQKAAYDKLSPEEKKTEDQKKQVEQMIKIRKKNPKAFKEMIKMSYSSSGMVGEGQLDTMVEQMMTLDDDALRSTMNATQWAQPYMEAVKPYMKPLMDGYNTFNSYTFGAGRYILIALVVYVIYLVLKMVWAVVVIVFGFGRGLIFGAPKAAQEVYSYDGAVDTDEFGTPSQSVGGDGKSDANLENFDDEF